MTWDLVEVSGIPEAADEYDCRFSRLLHQLREGASVVEIRVWLVGDVEGHFGMRADSVHEERLARQVSVWWGRGDSRIVRWGWRIDLSR